MKLTGKHLEIPSGMCYIRKFATILINKASHAVKELCPIIQFETGGSKRNIWVNKHLINLQIG